MYYIEIVDANIGPFLTPEAARGFAMEALDEMYNVVSHILVTKEVFSPEEWIREHETS